MDNEESSPVNCKIEQDDDDDDHHENFEEGPAGSPGEDYQIDKDLRDKHNEVHKKVLRKRKKMCCDLCEEKFWSKKGLREHSDKKHDGKGGRRVEVVTCNLCGVGFKEEGELTMHLVIKHRDKEVIRRVEGSSKYWRCQVRGCNNKYVSKEGLEKHWEGVHKGGEGKEVEKKWKCGICGKGFWNATKMKRHELIHGGDGRKDWRCEECGKSFGSKDYLKCHLWRHRKMEGDGRKGN